MTKQTIRLLVLGLGTLACPALAKEPYTFVPLDVRCPPGLSAAACPTGLVPGQVAAQTSLRGINARGDIVGFYVAATGGISHGFVLADGRVTTLDFPVPGVRSTIANGINPRGEIVGQYQLPVHDLKNPPPEDSPLYCPTAADPACIKGFYYYRRTFWTVKFPDTVDADGQVHTHPGAIAQRITADGDILGCLHDHDLGDSMFGAIWTRFGTFSLLANGGEVADQKPAPMSMNNGSSSGGKMVVGLMTDMTGQHGYVVRKGTLDEYNATATANLTAIWDINTNRQFVGVYREPVDALTQRHGFVQQPHQDTSIRLDFRCAQPGGCAGAPVGTVAFSTGAFGINPDGVVVGQYQLANGGAPHGFIATPDEKD